MAYEHEVLSQLSRQKLSFAVPLARPTLRDPNERFVTLSSGADACMFDLIPGHLPKLTCATDIGRAAGELCTAMAKVKVTVPPWPASTAVYLELYKSHHAVTRENFAAMVATPAFDECRAAITYLAAEITSLERAAARFNVPGPGYLPRQMIHGDLHYDNVLVQDGRTTGCLDFEFTVFDWRACELAVCLSKYAGEKDPMPYFTQFVDGYATTGRLTRAELEALPELINLRILSNVTYFVGRAVAGEDTIDALTTRAQMYADRVAWIKNNSKAIIDMAAARIKSDEPALV